MSFLRVGLGCKVYGYLNVIATLYIKQIPELIHDNQEQSLTKQEQYQTCIIEKKETGALGGISAIDKKRNILNVNK